MNGQLSEHPLAELIREISSKSLGGRVRLEHDRIQVVTYFDHGNFLYATSNVRTLQTRVADVLRLALLWTEGSWEFDSRARLNEPISISVDVESLLLEAARRLPAKFAASRFGNPAEMITPTAAPLDHDNLLPAEVFLISRLDRPTSVRELVALSGLGEEQTLGIVYSLALAGVLEREQWPVALQRQRRVAQKTTPPPPAPVEVKAVASSPSSDADSQDVENFLARVKNARTYYEVLDVGTEIPAHDLKTAYYQLARRYHPDRFRRADAVLLDRVQSAFARVTQAYDTLRDEGLRASYNAKIAARIKAQQLVDRTAKPLTPKPQPQTVSVDDAQPLMSAAEHAAIRAARGQSLAANVATQRAAEAELNAAIKLDPQNAEYRVMLAELYRDLGLKLRAKGEAERAVAVDPNNRKARELLRTLNELQKGTKST